MSKRGKSFSEVNNFVLKENKNNINTQLPDTFSLL